MNAPDINIFKKDVKVGFGVDLPISGGMGDSIENAFIIEESNSGKGISIEYKILDYLFGFMGLKEWKLEKQELIEKENRYYDKLQFSWDEDKENFHSYYFDITNFHEVFKD